MTCLVIFAKAPQPGAVKTRLIPALGADGAAALARAMLDHTLQQALAAGLDAVELCLSPAPGDTAWHGVTLPAGVVCTAQGEGDLGERMDRALQRALALHTGPVLLIGTDCPALGSAHLREAARQLVHHDAVLLPVADGGYVLIGLQAPCPAIFTNMAWSTPAVAAETLHRLAALGLRVWQGPMLHDIDEAADLAHLPSGFTNPKYQAKSASSPIRTSASSS
ncbi:MAG: TIGR04282 family arsenosugar biosynthesis glycosyltransferase [Polaromonas sp.]|uniref:TIGR04282 family arsenosugar biosynthesis glycosyltransferase n=1 Tax=Polaromonas sp. TaxID=1869339 RepID=UPI00248A88C2|nr:TIGR04282 family arsenosugar biosynthesis glycosyltransferase [Polaromonas sp.]MDI1238692.1 TIGR04282 family arsenosugar biosynthesis glycosyltransferase [Polaromonas sp.]MDI1340705.1 TIGR04282 family arsenosugar biosynthesis glycosyltransferase [Polaromonas sp.]